MKKHLTTALIFSGLIGTAAMAAIVPTNGGATPAGPKTIALHWTDNSDDETGFEITDDAGATILATVPANTQFYYGRSITGPETTKNYRVRAIGANNSPWLDLGAATTTIEMNILFFLADDMGYKDIVGLRHPEIYGASISNVTVFSTLDLDASPNTITTEVSINGAPPVNSTTINADPAASSFDAIKFSKSGTWTSPDTASIDYFKVNKITAGTSLYDSWATTHP